MAATDFPPRFFKVFISHFSSDTMLIPISYYDQFPRLLPKTAILQGTSGCCWNVAMKYKRDELYFGQGWAKFVKDNSLTDGDFLTFVYNGDRIFEVSIYGPDGCKETRSVIEVDDDDKEYSICSLSSQTTHTSSESEMINTISRRKRKEEVVEDSDDKEDNIYSLSSEETDTDSEFKMANTIPKRQKRKKGKTKEEVVEGSDEDSSDSDYIEAFGRLDFSENSDSDCSYSPKKKIIQRNPNKKGKSVEAISDESVELEAGKKARKVKAKIKNPEAYLDNPNNVYFETAVKNRKYELLVHAQLVKDYCLKFEDRINYIDKYGKIEAKTAKWQDQRVCIKRWIRICERNKLKKEDRILCELLRKRGLVYAVKLHIIRGKDL